MDREDRGKVDGKKVDGIDRGRVDGKKVDQPGIVVEDPAKEDSGTVLED